MDREFYAALAETPQLDALIAPDTGIGRSAFEIAGNKVVDDPGPKHFSGVDDFMQDLQLSAPHNGRYADPAASTFLPTLEDRDCCALVFPSLKRDAINVILSDQ